jgi:outer membrane protein assembly factor BamA
VGTRITVSERDHQRFDFGLAYGTEQKLIGDAEWSHQNLFGSARLLRLRGKLSWLERGVEGTFRQPHLFGPDLSLELTGHTWFTDERAYRVLSRGGRVSVTRILAERSTLTAGYVHEFESSRVSGDALADPSLRDELIALGLNPTTGEQDGLLSAWQLALTRDTADSPLDPQAGHRSSVYLEQAGGWLPGSFNYYNFSGDERYYYSIGALTLAVRGRLSTVWPMGPDSDVPFFKRYFLGGADSLRGWGRYEVSPLSNAGVPIGGFTAAAASAEARFPIAGRFGGILLFDAGNVWDGAWEIRPSDLLYDAGAGIRVQTPVGPFRLDYAYQLTPIEGLRLDGEPQDRRWRVHFSIGQAF